MPLFSRRLGLDIGTINVLITHRGQIVLREPSLVALTEEDERVIEIGQPVREMLGKTDEEDIQVVRPLQGGVIADYEVTEAMLRHFFSKVAGRMRLFRPTLMVTAPWGVTSVEKRAVHEAVLAAGAREVYMIHGPLAAAIGAGLSVGTPAGDLVINIGGGITEAAVISLNKIVRAESRRIGGLRLDEAIISYVRRKYNLSIGQPTAEAVKIQIGAAVAPPEEMSMEIQGSDYVSGLPRVIRVSSNEVVDALAEPLALLAAVVRTVLGETPPELASDIIDRGMVMTGGGALLRGLGQYLTRATEVPAYSAENATTASALGAGQALDDPAILRRVMQTTT